VPRIPAWAALGGLVAASTVVRAWAGLKIPSPWIAADEMIYAELGRSLWETGRLSILGADTAFYGLIHPALIGLPLVLFDTALGYDVARVVQALVMSLAAMPVFFWGRRLMAERWALAAAALTVAIPGLAYTGLLMTETVFYPAFVLAALAAARTLVSPTLANQGVLVGLVVLTVLTRLQGIVLVPAFLLAAVVYAALERRLAAVARFWPALAALALIAAIVLTLGFGAYEPAQTTTYDLSSAVRFIAYHAADLLLLVGVVPACAVALLALRPEPSPDVRAYLAVTTAFSAGLVAEVGLFASRYVGRLAERHLLGLAPLFFLGLCLWLDRGAPRTRLTSGVVGLAVAAVVLLFLPLGRLVHKAALPDAFSLVPVWELGDYELVVGGFVAAAVLAFVVLPRRTLWLLPVALGIVFAATSVTVSRYVTSEARVQATQFFGTVDPQWVDEAADGPVTYLYDGEPHWNAVWAYVFWNRDVDRVYRLGEARRVPGPIPQRAVDPFPFGRLGDDEGAAFVLAPTSLTFAGDAVATVEQVGLVHRGLVLWRASPPLRLRTMHVGVQGSGDIYGPAAITAFDCTGGSFELTLIAKGSPVAVRLESGAQIVERTLAPAEVWRPSVPVPTTPICSLAIAPETIVGSTRVEYVPGR
jgi:hypothetical protein